MTQPQAQTADAPGAIPALTIRPARFEDIDAIQALIDAASRTTTVLPRPRWSVVEQLRDFLVAVSDGGIVGCAALNLQSEGLAEIKSLVVAPELRGGGVGRRLVAALIDEGRRIGLDRVFALTDNVPFFEKSGFRLTDKETLPHKVWNECIRCPKFHNCVEDAVDLRLSAPDAAAKPGF